MINVSQEYRVDNWDGEGALPITDQAISVAEDFLSLLGENPPYHEIGFLHDGTIDFDFMEEENGIRKMLSISAELNGTIIFAYLNNDISDSGYLTKEEFHQHKLKEYIESFR